MAAKASCRWLSLDSRRRSKNADGSHPENGLRRQHPGPICPPSRNGPLFSSFLHPFARIHSIKYHLSSWNAVMVCQKTFNARSWPISRVQDQTTQTVKVCTVQPPPSFCNLLPLKKTSHFAHFPNQAQLTGRTLHLRNSPGTPWCLKNMFCFPLLVLKGSYHY